MYVSAASVLFILSGKYISENRETLPKRPFPYILSSVIFVNAGWLFMSSRDSLNWNLYIGLIAKFIIIMLLVRFSIFMVTNFLFEHRKALSEAILDDLTQTYNKRHFINTLESILSEISNFKDFPVSISIFDVDSFKQINDELSHLAGDYVLETLCKEIKKELSTKKIGGNFLDMVAMSLSLFLETSQGDNHRK
ncbi:GGDEF domain-containing protein [Lactococcus lactis]|uniref:GGDEF domain-containing protein n=1 Tax=Lactococcus lactis TaxID=1358 RepID=UPI003877CCF0